MQDAYPKRWEKTNKGIEPLYNGFADRSLTTWRIGHKCE